VSDLPGKTGRAPYARPHLATIIAMHHAVRTLTNIGKVLNLNSNTCRQILNHAKKNAEDSKDESDPLALLELIKPENLDSAHRSGQPKVLTEADKDHLIDVVKRDKSTRRSSSEGLQKAAGLCHVSSQTVLNAPYECGIKYYKENMKPIL